MSHSLTTHQVCQDGPCQLPQHLRHLLHRQLRCVVAVGVKRHKGRGWLGSILAPGCCRACCEKRQAREAQSTCRVVQGGEEASVVGAWMACGLPCRLLLPGLLREGTGLSGPGHLQGRGNTVTPSREEARSRRRSASHSDGGQHQYQSPYLLRGPIRCRRCPSPSHHRCHRRLDRHAGAGGEVFRRCKGAGSCLRQAEAHLARCCRCRRPDRLQPVEQVHCCWRCCIAWLCTGAQSPSVMQQLHLQVLAACSLRSAASSDYEAHLRTLPGTIGCCAPAPGVARCSIAPGPCCSGLCITSCCSDCIHARRILFVRKTG